MVQLSATQVLKEYLVDEDPILITLMCPGCRYEHGFRVNPEYWEYQRDITLDQIFTFNEDYQNVTFAEGFEFNRGKTTGTQYCKGYLKDHHWHFAAESSHFLAGVINVPLVEISLDQTRAQVLD